MKRSLKSLLLILVLAVMAAGVYGVRRLNQKESVTETTGSYPLTALTQSDVTGLAWQAADTAYHFTRQDGSWQNADDPAFPTNQDALDDMAEALAALTADRVIENVQDKADYGLDEPAFTLTAEWSDGTTVAYAMGDALPFGDGYYLGLSTEENRVYTLADSLETTFAKAGTDLAVLETLPTVDSATRLVVGSTLDVSYREVSTDLNPDQHWYTPDGTPVSDETVSGLIDAANAIAWQELVYPHADEDTLTSVALDEATATPITLYADDTPVLSLLIGGADSSAYYARLAGSSMVYKVASSSLTSLLNARPEDMLLSTLLPVSYENLLSATLTASDQTLTIVPEMPDTPSDETEAAETAETTEAPAASPEPDPLLEAQKSLWALVAELSGEPCQDDGQEAELVLAIEAVNRNNVSKRISIYAYDAEHYLARPENGASCLVSADAVDRIIRTIKQIH